MTVKCGFFNSIGQDRLYQADDMTRPYELLVSNGVFATQAGTPSNYLQVQASSPASMTIKVKAGRGIFFNKWLVNDADLFLVVSQSEVTLKRIDSVVVKIDLTESVRAASIYIKNGTPAATPSAPTLTSTGLIKEYRLANITVDAGVTTITQAKISDTRGTADCGWVTSLVQQVDTSTLYIQWEDAFDTWFEDVKENLSTSTLIRTFTSHYTTVTQDQTVIPINIVQFNYNLDILQVYINGLMLIRDVEYTSTNNDTVTLTNGVDTGTSISFVIYKSVDGSEAETVVEQIEELQELSITSNTGTSKYTLASGDNLLTSFIGFGLGFHTIYCPSGVTGLPVTAAFRVFGHLVNATVSSEVGWCIAMQANGSVYSNYCDDGTWQGWKTLHDAQHSRLYYFTAGAFPGSGVTVRPSKTLSDCSNGWQLIFTGYDDDTDTAKDFYTQIIHIPKKSYTGGNWNGESMTFPLVYSYDSTTDTNLQCTKTFTVYNDRFVSGQYNSTGVSRNMVLRAVYEY